MFDFRRCALGFLADHRLPEMSVQSGDQPGMKAEQGVGRAAWGGTCLPTKALDLGKPTGQQDPGPNLPHLRASQRGEQANSWPAHQPALPRPMGASGSGEEGREGTSSAGVLQLGPRKVRPLCLPQGRVLSSPTPWAGCGLISHSLWAFGGHLGGSRQPAFPLASSWDVPSWGREVTVAVSWGQMTMPSAGPPALCFCCPSVSSGFCV